MCWTPQCAKQTKLIRSEPFVLVFDRKKKITLNTIDLFVFLTVKFVHLPVCY